MDACDRRTCEELVVSVWMCVSISWRSKRTRESGVLRSSVGSDGLLVEVTSVFAKACGEKVGERKVS